MGANMVSHMYVSEMVLCIGNGFWLVRILLYVYSYLTCSPETHKDTTQRRRSS
jgi:hypothetical protein